MEGNQDCASIGMYFPRFQRWVRLQLKWHFYKIGTGVSTRGLRVLTGSTPEKEVYSLDEGQTIG